MQGETNVEQVPPTKILAISGRSQSGKSSLCNWFMGIQMLQSKMVLGATRTDRLGRLEVTDLFGSKVDDKEEWLGVFDPYKPGQSPRVYELAAQHLFPAYRIYAFADQLKNVCINVLGLTYEQMYGSDANKNTLTNMRWENLRGCCTDEVIFNGTSKASKWIAEHCFYHEPGPMTARQVMQFVGTEWFRQLYNDVWVDATLKQIQHDDPIYAFICDCRYPNEVSAIKTAGGKVVRLTRNQNVESTHQSELILDRANYDWTNFDAVVDNDGMTAAQSQVELHKVLTGWSWI